jgi:transposase-like protein
MPMNRIQFQSGLSLAQFMEQFGTEEQCYAALEQARWPNGFCCPRCQGSGYSWMIRQGRPYYQCSACRKQTTLTCGTIFASTKLPLRRWFLAMHLLTQAKNNVSALELMRHLGVSYPTAWLLKHKLMQVMAERERHGVLHGRAEIDDAYLGGEHPGGRRGRGSENKVPFVVAVQTREQGHQPIYVSLARIPFSSEAIERWARQALSTSAHIVSDGLQAFRALAQCAATHERHVVGAGVAAVTHPQFRAVNTVLGNLKTPITGTYHAFDFNKYSHRYLAEVQYRFNRRFELKAILPRLIKAAATTGAWTESRLRVAEIPC